MKVTDAAMILLAVEQSALAAVEQDAQPEHVDVWPTRIIGVGPLDNIEWYALTTTGVASPRYSTPAEAEAWAIEYNKGHY